MPTRHDDEVGETLERAIRTTDRAERSLEETPEAYGRRVADELFMKAVRSIEAKRQQH